MRDIKRIKIFCDELAKVWEQVPDWRFGQLFYNTFALVDKDFFYMEDDEVLSAFQGILKHKDKMED